MSRFAVANVCTALNSPTRSGHSHTRSIWACPVSTAAGGAPQEGRSLNARFSDFFAAASPPESRALMESSRYLNNRRNKGGTTPIAGLVPIAKNSSARPGNAVRSSERMRSSSTIRSCSTSHARSLRVRSEAPWRRLPSGESPVASGCQIAVCETTDSIQTSRAPSGNGA